MEKIAKTKASKTKTAGRGKSGRRQKLLHVSDFQDLYELADDLRKGRSGPLRFTRSLVTLSPFASDAESRYFERLCRLKARPERHLLRSILADVVNWTAAKPFGMRGFLVTAGGKAASCEYLAEQLSLSVDDLKQALPVLEEIGFLDRIPMNSQAEPEKPKPKRSRTRGKTGSAKTAKKPGKKSEQKNSRKAQNTTKHTSECPAERLPDSAGSSRTEPESLCPPSCKDKDKGKSKGKDNQKATRGLTAAGCKTNNNGNGISAEDNVNAQNKGNAQPLPSVPRESDDGGRANNFTRPPDSAEISRQGLIYGRKVYIALKLPWNIDGPEAAREIGSFASKHDTLCKRLSALSPPAVDAVLSRGLSEAAKITKRPANKNKGAVWHRVIDKLAAAAQLGPP